MVSWSTVKTLAITFGPFLLPKLIAFYRSIKASSHAAVIRPQPPYITRSLNILFAFAVVALCSTLPYFAPENVFKATDSRIQTPTNVIFNRLKAKRPLTPLDDRLRANFSSSDMRLNYLTFGPDVVANCPFCFSDDPRSFYMYALPSILAPHIFHIAVLGIVTSSFLSGPEGARWRTQATIAGVALAAVDAWVVGNYNQLDNARARHAGEISHFFWNMRLVRGVAIAAVDGLIGWALWLTSTNRWLAAPPSISERLEGTTRVMELVNGKLKALANIKNGVTRDRELRARNEAYWTHEGELTRDIGEDREVVDVTQEALGRIDVQDVTTRATQFADGVFGVLPSVTVTQQGGG